MRPRFTQQYGGSLALFAGAVLWFLPGIWWGETRMTSWAADEQVPRGAITAISVILGRGAGLSPQYPLGHYLVQAIFVLPGYAALSLADYLGVSVENYSTAVLTLLHRLPSVLMAAGTVVAARVFAMRAAGVAAGWVAAAAVATAGPIMFYARTGNVDIGALFWTAVALVVAMPVLRDGLTTKRAAALGLLAAVATATKDQQFAFFVGLGILLATIHLMDRRRSGAWAGWWRAPLTGIGVGGAAYLILSGALLLPVWFFERHVPFVLHGSADSQAMPAEIRRLSGFYGSNPGSLAGVGQVVVNATRQVMSAVGLPLFGLAGAGFLWLAARNQRLFWLLALPPAALILGVFAPVGFVMPRYLISVNFVVCLAAAMGLGAAARSNKFVQVGAGALAIVGIAWTGLRGADVTVQMVRDSRYEAALWLQQNILSGDVVGYYGAPGKLPELPEGTMTIPAFGQVYYFDDANPATQRPEFIVSIPQQINELAHEWLVDEEAFSSLVEGSSGYRQVFAFQTPALWPRPLFVASFVNPPVRVFAREDIISRINPIRIELPSPE
jgi:hypothetical protein